jgi:hypothetical protein
MPVIAAVRRCGLLDDVALDAPHCLNPRVPAGRRLDVGYKAGPIRREP